MPQCVIKILPDSVNLLPLDNRLRLTLSTGIPAQEVSHGAFILKVNSDGTDSIILCPRSLAILFPELLPPVEIKTHFE